MTVTHHNKNLWLLSSASALDCLRMAAKQIKELRNGPIIQDLKTLCHGHTDKHQHRSVWMCVRITGSDHVWSVLRSQVVCLQEYARQHVWVCGQYECHCWAATKQTSSHSSMLKSLPFLFLYAACFKPSSHEIGPWLDCWEIACTVHGFSGVCQGPVGAIRRQKETKKRLTDAKLLPLVQINSLIIHYLTLLCGHMLH